MSETVPTAGGASRFEPIALSSESTVVAEFEADPAEATRYQSEAELEAELVRLLREQAYEYLPITTEQDLSRTCARSSRRLTASSSPTRNGSDSSPP